MIEIERGKIRLGIEAPKHIRVNREENVNRPPKVGDGEVLT